MGSARRMAWFLDMTLESNQALFTAGRRASSPLDEPRPIWMDQFGSDKTICLIAMESMYSISWIVMFADEEGALVKMYKYCME